MCLGWPLEILTCIEMSTLTDFVRALSEVNIVTMGTCISEKVIFVVGWSVFQGQGN